MLRFIELAGIGALALAVAACGGRKSEIVPLERSYDDLLSCDHLLAEYDVNLKKAAALLGERSSEIENNFGLLLIAPLFLDFSGIEKKEIEALVLRNQELLRLMQANNCSDIPVLESSPSEAKVQESH